MKRKY